MASVDIYSSKLIEIKTSIAINENHGAMIALPRTGLFR